MMIDSPSALELSYLRRMLHHLNDRDPDDRVLKTYLDSWFAHSRGDRMLERGLKRPQWMNTGDIARFPHLCGEVHAISLKADEQLKISPNSLVRDHTIPKRVIICELKRRCRDQSWTIDSTKSIREMLKLWFTVSIITKQEHTGMKFASSMPIELTDNLLRTDPHARFARYHHGLVNIAYRTLPLSQQAWG